MKASVKKNAIFAKHNSLPLKGAISVVAVEVAPMSFTLRTQRGIGGGSFQWSPLETVSL